MRRACVFVDGEKFRHSLKHLFASGRCSFGKGDYLPETDWHAFFTSLADLLRVYWHVVEHVGCRPYKIPHEWDAKEKVLARWYCEGGTAMKRKVDIEVIHGSGNVFRDLKRPGAHVRRLKGILAAEIIKMLGRDRLTLGAAQTRTGIAAAGFSKIRNADLARFTVDRLMTIINRLRSSVEAAGNRGFSAR